MIELQLPFRKEGQGPTVLCLGAHCDDIEIGCGGTVLSLARRYAGLQVHWVVFASNEARALEAQNSASAFLRDVSDAQVKIESFRESYFPYVGADIKDYFETIGRNVSPDLVFTHYREDRHQDHRLISELTWNTFRDHMILEYEIPKFDGDMGCPSVFVPLTKAESERKVSLILEHFPSQVPRDWFEASTFHSLLRLRGMECNAPERRAEAFYCRKVVL